MDVKSLNQQSLSHYLQFDQLKRSWQDALVEPRFKIELTLTLVFSCLLMSTMPSFFHLIQSRPGYMPNDPLLDMIRPMDVSSYLFLFLHSSIVFVLIYMFYSPKQFVWGVQAYCVLTMVRFAALYLVPLEPSPQLIPLVDPVLNNLFYKSPSITKDLFFSGHTSTIFLFALVVNHKGLKLFFTIATLIIGGLVMVQHIHYSFDVFAAPFFAWLSVMMVTLAHKGLAKLRGEQSENLGAITDNA